MKSKTTNRKDHRKHRKHRNGSKRKNAYYGQVMPYKTKIEKNPGGGYYSLFRPAGRYYSMITPYASLQAPMLYGHWAVKGPYDSDAITNQVNIIDGFRLTNYQQHIRYI